MQSNILRNKTNTDPFMESFPELIDGGVMGHCVHGKKGLCKQYCGAVAVSWYRSEYTVKTINCLINHRVKTNIHYVLADNSIDEAIKRLKTNDFPKGINAAM